MVQDIQDRKDPGVTVTPQRALLLIQPELVLNRAITPTGRLLWMVIETYRDQNSDQVVLSLDVAAADLSITRKTLLVHIAELEHHGLLSRKRGRHQNTYTLHRSPPTAREIPPPYRRRVEKLHSARRVEKLHSEPLTVEKLHPAHRVEKLHSEPGSDEIVMSASLEVTGPQPVTSTPEGTEVPPVPSPEEPVLVTPEVTRRYLLPHYPS
jgi:hypothetical protein